MEFIFCRNWFRCKVTVDSYVAMVTDIGDPIALPNDCWQMSFQKAKQVTLRQKHRRVRISVEVRHVHSQKTHTDLDFATHRTLQFAVVNTPQSKAKTHCIESIMQENIKKLLLVLSLSRPSITSQQQKQKTMSHLKQELELLFWPN